METPPRPDQRSAADHGLLVNYDAALQQKQRDRYGLHLGLFLLTFAACTFMGSVWVGRAALYPAGGWLAFGEPGWWTLAMDGLAYAVPLLLFLTCHEFGHYLAARYHRIDVSLPYYIPLPDFGALGIFFHFGTMGAVIRIREPLRRLNHLFDVGIAGPLAGFVVTIGALIYALLTLPGPEYLLGVGGAAHEALVQAWQGTGVAPPPSPSGTGFPTIVFGETLLISLLADVVPNFPPMHEIYHYPVLFAAWIGLFFTALNLLPVGQLDGGHITFALFGDRWHRIIARATVFLMILSGGLGFVDEIPLMFQLRLGWSAQLASVAVWALLSGVLYLFLNRMFDRDLRLVAPALIAVTLAIALGSRVPGLTEAFGFWFWLVWVALIVYLIRIEHPPVLIPEPLSPRRRLLGYASLLIFPLCFTFTPIYLL
ncbi:MAG: site-2 protease family protein [Bacteroidota bacterium]